MSHAAFYAEQGLAHVGASDQPAGKPAREASARTRKLFVLLHGAYGSSFLSKFHTGQLGDDRQDKGVRMAMLVWDSALARYSDEVVELAVDRIKRASPEFAPTLPMFERECEAAQPAQTYAQQQGWKALPAPQVQPVQVNLPRRDDGKDWARRILARVERGDKSISRYARCSAEMAMGLRKSMS